MFPRPEQLCPFKVRSTSNRAFPSDLQVRKAILLVMVDAKRDFHHVDNGSWDVLATIPSQIPTHKTSLLSQTQGQLPPELATEDPWRRLIF